MEATLDKFRPQMLSILRIMMGLLYFGHGVQKWFGFAVAAPFAANITLFSMLGIAGVIELVCGAPVRGRTVHALRCVFDLGPNGGELLDLCQPAS